MFSDRRNKDECISNACRFSEKLKDSKEMGIKRGMMSGLGGGVLWLVTYCCYAVAFVYGVRLIVWSWEADDTKYTPGILIIVRSSTFRGFSWKSMNLQKIPPHFSGFLRNCNGGYKYGLRYCPR